MPSFNFTFDSFQITQTRSQHKDTDYVSFTLKVGGGAPQTLVKSMGDVNNGLYTVNLSFTNIPVNTPDSVVLNYMIVNSGGDNRVDVETTMENVGAATANGNGPKFPQLSSALAAGATWFNSGLNRTYRSLCDGLVAAEQDVFTYNDLVNKASTNPFHQSTPQPGINTVHGCNTKLSAYVANWHMAATVSVPDVAGKQPGTAETMILAAGLTYGKPLGTGPIVSHQAPIAGVPVDIRDQVTLYLGNAIS